MKSCYPQQWGTRSNHWLLFGFVGILLTIVSFHRNTISVPHTKALQINQHRRLATLPEGCPPPGTDFQKYLQIKILHLGRENKKKFNVYHIGKAGGGALQMRLHSGWWLRYNECHPYPCGPETVADANLILIRDPVERAVSAFNWRTTVLCHPDGDKRTVHKERATRHPDEYCKSDFPEEAHMLFHKYKSDINILAQALCSNDKLVRNSAVKDLRSIHHIQFNLSEWLSKMNWKTASDRIFPIVLEHGYDLNEQIDETIELVQRKIQLEDSILFAKRRKRVFYKDCRVNDMEHVREKMAKKGGTLVHTGAKHNKKSLLPNAETCLAQYYIRDYLKILRLVDLCWTNNCRNALLSILHRRSKIIGDHPELKPLF